MGQRWQRGRVRGAEATSGRRRRLDCRFEIRVLDGPEGKELARPQAAVIRDLLVWAAEQRRAAEAEPEAGHTAAPPPERDA
ncbi:hypothetical protein ACIRVK_15585 [Streptomyces sp. NPDC101152]|uniref:hypothetical protein n=1 Tax=Streptomyces sp. NPDC101152 TaxID=3366116 RepID=UPI0037F69E4D